MDIPGVKTIYIDNGFYQISEKDARKLCDGTLPRVGYEKLIAVDDHHFWVARTRHNERMVWSIRDSGGWYFVNGIATLG